MTFREFMEAPRMRQALGFLGLGVVVTGWCLVQAVRPPALQAVAPTATPTLAALQLPPQPQLVDGDAVAQADIFSVDRKPGRNRYRMPGEKDATDVNQTKAAPRLPVVIGTAVGPHPIATIQMAGTYAQPRSVSVGANVDGFIIIAIGNTSVRFLTPVGDTLEVFRSR